MTQRAKSTSSYYDDMPLAQLLFRYLWPFWLFKDATHGDRMVRAAAYRHNRSMRAYLPGYMRRWVLGSTVALAIINAADLLSDHTAGTALSVFSLIAGASAIAFVCCLCVLLLIAYLYLYLNRCEA
jgi:hypothetical protein